MKRYHFIGIGGKGMNPIAQYLNFLGNNVTGSDRYFDRKENNSLYHKLVAQGIKIFPQDGSAFAYQQIDEVIISSAIESINPDLAMATKRKIPIFKRAEILASIFNTKYGIAIGGTSGKTTVTGMLATMLNETGFSPTCILGGELIQEYNDKFTGNLLAGNSEYLCIEADESDGSIINYLPKIAIITNISKDHKDIPELVKLFAQFALNTTKYLVINKDYDLISSLKTSAEIITFSAKQSADFSAQKINFSREFTEFNVNGIKFCISGVGIHNVENALAVIALGTKLGLSLQDIAAALHKFKGIKRRLQTIGNCNGIRVVDDYAHNPAKISAAVKALQINHPRLIVIYQCHGYKPTSFFWNDLVNTLGNGLREKDILIIPDVYDVGGTTERNFTVEELIKEIKQIHKQSYYLPSRNEIIDFIKNIITTGDCVAVIGGRDDSLSEFAAKIYQVLSG